MSSEPLTTNAGGPAGGGGNPTSPPPPSSHHSSHGGYNFIPIEISSEAASDEARAIDESLVPFPLFDMIDLVPLIPLYEVEAPSFAETNPGCDDCCKSWTKFVFLLFNYLAVTAYPAAVCYKEYIRFCGYCGYYFCVVPSRYYSNYVAKPCVDSYYRYIKPKIVAIQLLIFRPCIALWAQCCQATWAPCCNRPKSYKAEANI